LLGGEPSVIVVDHEGSMLIGGENEIEPAVVVEIDEGDAGDVVVLQGRNVDLLADEALASIIGVEGESGIGCQHKVDPAVIVNVSRRNTSELGKGPFEPQHREGERLVDA